MRQQVYVTELIGDDAIVSGQRQSACASCAGKSSCSTLGSWQSSRPVTMRVNNALHAQVGDCVDIEVADNLVLKASFRLYAVPMLAFMIAGLIGWSLARALSFSAVDTIAAISAIAGVLLSYFWIWRQDGQQQHSVATIVAIHSDKAH